MKEAIDDGDVDVGEQERGFRERIGGWARAFGLGARAASDRATHEGGMARVDLLRWSADLFSRAPAAPKEAVTVDPTAVQPAQAQIVQFHVIRGPDEMVGSRNEGGARLFFFALDASGQLWRGVEEKGAQPVWSRIAGPFDPGASSTDVTPAEHAA